MTSASIEDEDWIQRSHRWFEAHQAHADAWIAAVGGPKPSAHGCVRSSAVHALLRVPEARAEGLLPGEPQREAYAWDEIDAYEILFGQVVYGGAIAYDPREFLALIGSFAAHLGEAGVIPALEHARLQAQWDAWSARVLDVWANCSWYERDGRRISPEALRERNDRAKPRRRSGSRFGKFRRRRARG